MLTRYCRPKSKRHRAAVAQPATLPPYFSVLPTITPTSGAIGTTFTAHDGTHNGTSTSRRWLLNGTSIGTNPTIAPVLTGSLVLEVTATGATGLQTIGLSDPVTVTSGNTIDTLYPGPTWGGTENSGGVAQIQSDVINGVGYTTRAIGRVRNIAPDSLIEVGVDNCIGVTAYHRSGIARVDFIAEGSIVSTTTRSEHPVTGHIAYHCYLDNHPGTSGNARLYIRIVPNAGTERLLDVPIRLDMHGLITRTKLYVDPQNVAASDSNNGLTTGAPLASINGALSKCTDASVRYEIRVRSTSISMPVTTAGSLNQQILIVPDTGFTMDDVPITKLDRRLNLGVYQIRNKKVCFRGFRFDLSKICTFSIDSANGTLAFEDCELIDPNGVLGPELTVDGATFPAGYGILPDTTTQTLFTVSAALSQTYSLIRCKIESYLSAGAQLYYLVDGQVSADAIFWTTKGLGIFKSRIAQDYEFKQRRSYEQYLRIATKVYNSGTGRTDLTFQRYAGPGTVSGTTGNANFVFSTPSGVGPNQLIRLINVPGQPSLNGTDWRAVNNTSLYNVSAMPTTIAMTTAPGVDFSGATYEIYPLIAGIVAPGQSNQSCEFLTGALTGQGADDGFPIYQAVQSTGIMTVTGDASGCAVGDVVRPYIIFHADANQQGGLLSTDPNVENIIEEGYEAPGISYQPILAQAFNGVNPKPGTLATTGTAYTITVPPLSTFVASINGTSLTVTSITSGQVPVAGHTIFYTSSPDYLTIGGTMASFTGSISGNTLTTSGLLTGSTIAINQIVSYPGAPANLKILSGSGSTWTLDQNVGSVGSQAMLSQLLTVNSNQGTVASQTMTSKIMPRILVGNGIQADSGTDRYHSRRVVSCDTHYGLTGVLDSAFPSGNVDGINWLNAKSINDVAILNSVITERHLSAFHAQIQNYERNWNLIGTSILGGDPELANGVGGYLFFRTANGGGFGLEDFYVENCIMTRISVDTAAGMPKRGLTLDNNHFLLEAVSPATSGTNYTVGAVPGLTEARKWWASNWAGIKTVTDVADLDYDMHYNPREVGDPVGPVAKQPAGVT